MWRCNGMASTATGWSPAGARSRNDRRITTPSAPPPRTDIPEKVFARHKFVTDIRLPGMLHARMIRPAVTGSVPTAVDDASIAGIPGVRVVWKQGFLGVAAPREWDAIRAAATLKVTWSQAAPPFPGNAALYDHIRAATPIARKEIMKQGDADAAIAGAARIVEAEYEWPFQSHASMGPACAVVDASLTPQPSGPAPRSRTSPPSASPASWA